jgi:26S proteasome regulatory subunit N6
LSIKLALKYAQLRDVESMRAVARAHQTRDLAAFEQTLRDYREELSSDPTIRSHLAALYDTLLEQNLLRIVEPYSVVEIEYVAGQVRQGRQDVEAKYATPLPLVSVLYELTFGVPRDRLSQMILDKIFHGVLDQGRGCLLVFDEAETNVGCQTDLVLFTCSSHRRTRTVLRSTHSKK